MIEIINSFVNSRKELWLEPRLKKATDEEAIQIRNEANEKFNLQNWLPDAAKRAGQLSITTHPSKFTHPSAKSTSVIANNKQSNDGYLRSGNVSSPLDVFGNAAAMDVYRFLSIPLSEESTRTLLDAFENSDSELEQSINNLGLNFEELKIDFLKIKSESGIVKTDLLLKQVYFPISKEHEYHLLSILTASGLITELKQRVDSIRFSENTKNARAAKKAGNNDEYGYKDLFDLTIVGYGGTKPQNISVLNNQNYGKSYLLPCIPPLFEKRPVKLPTRDFFVQTLYLKAETDRFIALHKIVLKKNNSEASQSIKKIISGIIDQILYKAYQLRQSNEKGWSQSEHYKGLSLSQQIWLDDMYEADRINNEEWRDDIAKDMARVMVEMYEDINQVKILGDPELTYIQKLIIERIEEDKEFF